MEYQVHNDVLPILLCNTNSVRLLNQNTSKSGVGHCGSIALGEIGQLVMGSVIDLVRRTVFVSSHPSDQLSQGSRIAQSANHPLGPFWFLPSSLRDALHIQNG